jgi:hypothetical protein
MMPSLLSLHVQQVLPIPKIPGLPTLHHIHVERVIGKMRNYLILQSTIPVNQVRLLDDIVVIIAALTNILPSVVPSDFITMG